VVLPSADTGVAAQALERVLSRLRGQRALYIGIGGENILAHLTRQFETVETIEEAPGSVKGQSADGIRLPSTMDPGALKFASDWFDLVAFCWFFHRVQNRPTVLAEVRRVLKPQGHILIIDGIPRAGNERQLTHLMLRQMMADRDEALSGVSFAILTADEIQRELRAAGFHHLRRHEYFQTEPMPGGDDELKEQALTTLRTDVIPSLVQLGSRRSEFERRLVEIKQRIQRFGIEIHPYAALTGMKKVARRVQQPSLFSAEADTSTASPSDIRYDLRRELEQDDLPLEERLLSLGPSSLRTPELLAFLLSPGEPKAARELAERILTDYGSKGVAEERNPHRLKEALNVSLPVACRITALFEIGRRFFEKSKTRVLRGPEDVYHHLRHMAKLKRERFRALFLNHRGELVGDEVIATGDLSGADLHPGEVFGRATEHKAAAVILCHNHPSGDSSPSSEDIELTRRLAKVGREVGIELLDHIIITDGTWASLREAHLL
jgi:DNA repair protein RadC